MGDVVAIEVEALESAVRIFSDLLQDFLGDLVADFALAKDQVLQRRPDAGKEDISSLGMLQQGIPLEVKSSELL